jgi:hypothetical protein
MARKAKASRYRAPDPANYTAWKTEALADLANRHGVRVGIIPERLWRLYIQGRSPHDAEDQAAVSAYNRRSAAKSVAQTVSGPGAQADPPDTPVNAKRVLPA